MNIKIETVMKYKKLDRITSKSRLQRYLLPSLKGRGRGVGLLFTMLLSVVLALQASAYSVTTVTEAPQWQIDWSSNDERPDWSLTVPSMRTGQS